MLTLQLRVTRLRRRIWVPMTRRRSVSIWSYGYLQLYVQPRVTLEEVDITSPTHFDSGRSRVPVTCLRLALTYASCHKPLHFPGVVVLRGGRFPCLRRCLASDGRRCPKSKTGAAPASAIRAREEVKTPRCSPQSPCPNRHHRQAAVAVESQRPRQQLHVLGAEAITRRAAAMI